MEIYLKIRNQNTSVKLLVNSEEIVNVDNLKLDIKAIFDKYAGRTKPVVVDIKDLQVRTPDQVEDKSFQVSIKTIEAVQTLSLQKSFKQIFWKLFHKKVHSFKDFWMVAIVPFQAIHRYLYQDKKLEKKLHNAFGTEISSYKAFIKRFSHFRSQLDTSFKGKKVEGNNLKNTLDHLIEAGEDIQKLLSAKDKDVYATAEKLAAGIHAKYQAAQTQAQPKAFLGAVPTFAHINGIPTPLVVNFRKEDTAVYIDIHGLPSENTITLNSSYCLKDELEINQLTALVQAVLIPLLASEVSSKEAKFSYRENIRLENFVLGGASPFNTEATSKTNNQGSALNWLHSLLSDYAEPVTSEKNSKNNVFISLIKEFEKHFPEEAFIDRLEWALVSVEEEYQNLFSVLPKLDINDQLRFLERLESDINALKTYLGKDKVKDNPIFKKFNEKLVACKQQKAKIRDKIFALQKNKLAAKVTSEKTKTKVNLNKNTFFDIEKGNKKAVQEAVISPEILEKVKDLQDSVAKNLGGVAYQRAQELHQEADRLIENKQYTSAYQLALLTFQSLPVPVYGSNAFYDDFTSADNYSNLICNLAKDIWESSLRLNYNYPSPEVIIQMMKAQLIAFKGNSNDIPILDYAELENIIHLHPHVRFGWKPEHVKEVQEIVNYIEAYKNAKKIPWRADTTIHISNHGIELTDQTKIQAMFSSLMKPDYTLCPFHGAGKINQSLGIKWMDAVEAEAVANGAMTPEEVRKEIKRIRLKQTQQLIASMRRLDFGIGKFVTEFDCITVFDPKSHSKAPVLAYLPNGYGLPRQYEDKYGVIVDEGNTQPLAGQARGEKAILTDQDDYDYTLNREIGSLYRHDLRDALSPRPAYTEATLLYQNLQKDPRGQVSQFENHLIESMQMGSPENNGLSFVAGHTSYYHSPDKDKPLHAGSILEALGFLFNERHLADAEIQRSVLLLLTRSFLLEKELKKSPDKILTMAKNLHKLIDKKYADPLVFPFLLQVGQIIKEHADHLKNENNPTIDEIVITIPCFDSQLTVGKNTLTGKQWLETILKDPSKEHSLASVAYLFAMMDQPVAALEPQTVAMLLYTASRFNVIGDSVGIPQFNRIVEKWIKEKLLPEVETYLEDGSKLSSTLDLWMELGLPQELLGHPTPWNVNPKDPSKYENKEFEIHLPTLQITSKTSQKMLGIQKVNLPAAVQRSANCLTLFGTDPIQAELSRDDNPNHFIYTFTFGPQKQTFRIIHDQSNGNISIHSLLPTNPAKKQGAHEWFVYAKEISQAGHSAVENAIAKNGLWVSLKNKKKAYFFVAPLSEAKRSAMFSVTLDSSGKLGEIRNVKSNLSVAVLSEQKTSKIVPFANGEETLILMSGGKIQEIHCLDQRSKFIKEKSGKWFYHNPKLGQVWEWTLDLSTRNNQIQTDTQEKRFLESFGGDQFKFLVPLNQGATRQYLLFPFEIKNCPKAGLQFHQGAQDKTILQTPITLSFGDNGELQGSCSTFLYLAYYFCMKKDFDRAEFYLEKAKKATAVSEQEKLVFEKIALLFESIPQNSLRSLSFQLKAQLHIHDIVRTQFSSTLYSRESEGKCLINFTHIAELYERYKKDVDANPEFSFKLEDKDLFQLDRVLWSSFKRWSDQQTQIDETKQVQTAPAAVATGVQEPTFINSEILSEIPEGFFAACIMMSKDIKEMPAKDLSKLLLSDAIPQTDKLVHHAFHYYNLIAGKPNPQTGAIENAEDPRKILNFLTAIPQWELHPPQTEQGKQMASLAAFTRAVLIAMCIERIQGKSVQPIDFQVVKELNNQLPYWGRQNLKYIRLFLNLYDLYGGFIDIREKVANDIENFVSHANDIAYDIEYRIENMLPKLGQFIKNSEIIHAVVNFIFENKVSDFLINKYLLPKLREKHLSPQFLKVFPLPNLINVQPPHATNYTSTSTHDQDSGQGGISLNAIINEFDNLPTEHGYFPFEVSEIPEIIRNENTDRELKRDISVLGRESAARSFPMIQYRYLAENMRQIALEEGKIATNIPQRKQRAAEVQPIAEIAPVIALQKKLVEEIQSFSKLSQSDEQNQQKAIDNLKAKYEVAKKYFAVRETDSPAKQEECKELLLGLDLAYETIEEEIKQKPSFTPQELKSFKAFLDTHVHNTANKEDSLKVISANKNNEFIQALLKVEPSLLPKKLKKMLAHRDLYTDFEIIEATQKLFKDPKHSDWFAKDGRRFETLMTEALLYSTAYQQMKNAYATLTANPDDLKAAKALSILKTGLQLDRYFKSAEELSPLVARKALVAEARAGIIFRKGQRTIMQKTALDPKQWISLRMGLGKTSYGMPAIAEILSEQGHSVVFTVPEKLLKSNRKDFDKSTRLMFDMASLEFTMPLVHELPLNYLAEKVLQVEKIFRKKGYVVTTVEELATLHNTCIMLEDEKLAMSEKDQTKFTEEDGIKLLNIEMRLHYYKKLDRLLNGNATELNISGIFFGDEADDTHHITHEVSIAVGKKIDPSKPVREVSRTIMEEVMAATTPTLSYLRDSLIKNTYAGTIKTKEMENYKKDLAKALFTSKHFLDLIGEEGQELLKKIDVQQWIDYISGATEVLPDNMPAWDKTNIPLNKAQKHIAIAKQLVSTTLPNFLSQKPGNEFGLSDFEGFIVVPKITKNETEGMRFGDEFEMIFAQYMGYLEYVPCQSLTDKSDEFLANAMKTFKEKSPSSYAKLAADYNRDVVQPLKGQKDVEIPDIFEYLKRPSSYEHRWNILDDVIFDGGFIKRYEEQVHTNVQEIFHRKACGGVTGTLDPYILPYISDKVLLNLHDDTDKKTSTREVEAETFLRMGLNFDKGLDENTHIYQDGDALTAIDNLLGDKETKAIINSNGVTSEGMNTLTWIAHIRKLANGKDRSYLFMHPIERIPYLWENGAIKAVSYKEGMPLPENTVCMYAPSDVRGVHLPIKKGKVRWFANATATPQEAVQSIYRARQLGGDHELTVHIPSSLNEKIQSEKSNASPVTAGDVINYIIDRTASQRQELDLNAQIAKINLDLKTTVADYLKETNPDFDKINHWTKNEFENIIVHAFSNALIFKELRNLFIHVKEIDFEGCYTPRKLIDGVDRVINEFDKIKLQIETLLPKLKDAAFESFKINAATQPTKLQEFKCLLPLVYAAITQDAASSSPALTQQLTTQFNTTVMMLMMAMTANNHQVAFNLMLDIKQILQNIQANEKANEELKILASDLLQLTNELMYGKGKSDLLTKLTQLRDSITDKKANFDTYKELHKKYLPEKTVETPIGNAGVNEQVKEMQQQKNKATEEVATDPNHKTNRQIGGNDYLPLDPTEIYSPHGSLPALGNKAPLNSIYMSEDVQLMIKYVLPFMSGDPLFYIAVCKNNGNTKITLISKMDYHYKIESQLPLNTYANVSIYKLLPTGVQWMAGGRNTSCDDPIPTYIMNKLLTIKAYLGYKEEFAEMTPEVAEWKKSLNRDEIKALQDHIDEKGTPSQKSVFKNLV